MAHVAWAVNLACLGFHVWPYLAERPEVTDELRLDLDPQPGVGFEEARAAAAEVRGLLDELGIAGYPKTTGNRGVHVYVRLEPRWDSYDVRRAAVAAARELERRRPELITAAWWKEERGERIFVDYNQNAPAQDRLRRLVGARPRRRPGLDAPHLGRDRRDPPRRADDRERPRAGRGAGRPVGGHERARRSRSSRSSPSTSATGPPASWTRPWPPVYPKQPDEPPRVAPSRARKETR